MITAAGIGSGLDINGIVEQLLTLERRPLDKLNQRDSTLQVQLSDIGRLKGALDTFQAAMDNLADASKFNIFTATSSDEDAITASADSTAAIGTANIDIDVLAEAHKSASDPYTDGDTVPVTTPDVDMSIQVGSDPAFSFEITNLSLNQIRDAINSDSGNTGVTATVINEDLGSRLVLTSDETGTANALTLSFTEGGSPTADPLDMTTINPAANAELTVDGFDVTHSSNQVDGVLQGVTLNLKQVTAGEIELSIARDDAKVIESVQTFADEFNNLRSLIDTLGSGSLQGDSTLRSIERRLLNELNTSAGGSSFSYLSEIGVSLDKNGVMAVDSDQVTTAMNQDFTDFAALFSADSSGFAFRFEALADDMLSTTDGIIQSRTDGIESRLDLLDNQRDRLERRFDATEVRLRNEFAALDALLGQLQNTSAFLSQQLG